MSSSSQDYDPNLQLIYDSIGHTQGLADDPNT